LQRKVDQHTIHWVKRITAQDALSFVLSHYSGKPTLLKAQLWKTRQPANHAAIASFAVNLASALDGTNDLDAIALPVQEICLDKPRQSGYNAPQCQI
jgi:hypothetical protein